MNLTNQWEHLFFFPLPDTASSKPHFIGADLAGCFVVSQITICQHRQNKWPRGLKRDRKLTEVRASGFRTVKRRGTDKTDVELRPFMDYAVSLGADHATWLRSQFVRLTDGLRQNGKRQITYDLDPGKGGAK